MSYHLILSVWYGIPNLSLKQCNLNSHDIRRQGGGAHFRFNRKASNDIVAVFFFFLVSETLAIAAADNACMTGCPSTAPCPNGLALNTAVIRHIFRSTQAAFGSSYAANFRLGARWPKKKVVRANTCQTLGTFICLICYCNAFIIGYRKLDFDT